MCTYRLALVLRSVAIILFSFAIVSCGSGSGKATVSSPNDAAERLPELRLVFEDDFGGPIGAASRNSDAALPASNWRVERGYGDNGWGNDEWQNYTNSTDNLYLENGALVISAQCSTGDSCSNVGVNKRTGNITSARINTKEKFNVRYGSVSARIKMPSGVGTWPAFWMLGADIDDLRWPDAGEIDIVEMHYKYSDNKTTHFTTHWSAPNYAEGTAPTCSARIPGVNAGEEQHCYTATKKFDTPLTDDFHVFELVWNENSITGKIDDVTYYTLGIDPATMEEFLKDYFMILNVAVGGTLGGTPSATMDWSNPDQTNMLVDWVRIYDRAQSDNSTLVDESGNNLPYNRIINSAEFGGAFVDSDLDSAAVAPLVGDQVLELDYYTSLSSGGGATADYSAAYFSFNRIDLSDFNNMIFSMDVSRFKNFDDVAVEFEDFNAGKASVRTSDLTPIATIGNWNTYKVPFSDYAGVAMDDIKFLAITSPNDVNNNLLGGKLYLDDIRFTQEACKAQGVITFDSANFNPDTRVGAVNIDNICAAGSLASINVDNGSEQITLGVKLDAAGKGRVTFGLVNGRSICLVDDQESVLPLSGTLTATYTKTLFDEAAVQSTVVVMAQAGVDESAPSTVLAGDELFLYSTDQTSTFLPDNDFAYSVFGSGSVLNGAASDVTFNPAFGVTSGIGYGGGIHVAQIVWLGGEDFPSFAGFADGKQSLNFKIKDLPSNTVKIEVGVAGADVDEVVITDVTSSTFSTPIGSTGWYQIVIPLAEFPASSAADFIAITGTDGGTSAFTFLITDVAVQESLSNVDASCEELLPDPDVVESSILLPLDFELSGADYLREVFGGGSALVAADPVHTGNNALQFNRPVGAEWWSGGVIDLDTAVDATTGSFSMELYSTVALAYVELKFEQVADSNQTIISTTHGGSGWETLTFDTSSGTITGTPSAVTTVIFTPRVTSDGSHTQSTDEVYYFDEIVVVPPPIELPLDFELSGADYLREVFGGGSAVVAADPLVGSNNALQFNRPLGAEWWSGGVIDLDTAVDATTGSFSMELYSTVALAYVELKFEQVADSNQTIISTTHGGLGWETLTFDTSSGTITGTPSAATTVIFTPRVTSDGSHTQSADEVYYFDDIAVAGGSSGGGQLAVNGDIEAGDLSSWTTAENGGSITADNTQDGGGTWSVHVVAGPGNNPSISLADLAVGTVMSGDTIDVSFDMCGSAASGGVIFPALLSEFGGGTGADRTTLETIASPLSEWTRYNYSATAGSNVTGGVSLQFDVVCGAVASCAADVYFDNVSITIGGGAVPGTATGSSCAAPPPPGVTLPIDFEDAPYNFRDGGGFGGGYAEVVDNLESSGINDSVKVGRMIKDAGEPYGGSTFDLGGTLAVPANSAFTMKVWASRLVPVLFKLEGDLVGEITATHTGSSTWEELTFDFDGVIGEGNITGITFIYDNGENGQAATDPGNWTFYFDDIAFGVAPLTPSVFSAAVYEEALVNTVSVFQDGDSAVTEVVAADTDYGAVLNINYTGNGIAGIGHGTLLDASAFEATGTLEFDAFLIQDDAGGVPWKLKIEGANGGIAVEVPFTDSNESLAPAVGIWQHYTFDIASALNGGNMDWSAVNLMLFFSNYEGGLGEIQVDNIVFNNPGLVVYQDAFVNTVSAFVDGASAVTEVAATDAAFGTVLNINYTGNGIAGIGHGTLLDVSAYATDGTLEFDALVIRDDAGSVPWKLKIEGSSGAIFVEVPFTDSNEGLAPVVGTWQHYTFDIASALNGGNMDWSVVNLMLFFSNYTGGLGEIQIDNIGFRPASGGGGGGPATGEQVVNGDFETGDFSNWEQSINTGVQSISNDTPFSSTSSASINSTGTSEIKQANLGAGSLALGDTVRIQFDVKGTFGTGGQLNVLSFTEFGGGGGTLSNNTIIAGGVDAWTHYDYNVILGGPDADGGFSLAFNPVCGADAGCFANVFIDNVSVFVVP
jgi:beta-glucanase (GH16 family)